MIKYLGTTFAFPGMRKVVEVTVKTCELCQRYKITRPDKYGKVPLVPPLKDKERREKAQVDLCGPWSIEVKIPGSTKKEKHIIHHM